MILGDLIPSMKTENQLFAEQNELMARQDDQYQQMAEHAKHMDSVRESIHSRQLEHYRKVQESIKHTYDMEEARIKRVQVLNSTDEDVGLKQMKLENIQFISQMRERMYDEETIAQAEKYFAIQEKIYENDVRETNVQRKLEKIDFAKSGKEKRMAALQEELDDWEKQIDLTGKSMSDLKKRGKRSHTYKYLDANRKRKVNAWIKSYREWEALQSQVNDLEVERYGILQNEGYDRNASLWGVDQDVVGLFKDFGENGGRLITDTSMYGVRNFQNQFNKELESYYRESLSQAKLDTSVAEQIRDTLWRLEGGFER